MTSKQLQMKHLNIKVHVNKYDIDEEEYVDNDLLLELEYDFNLDVLVLEDADIEEVIYETLEDLVEYPVESFNYEIEEIS